jgi:phage host-nuclease inhibitor protein Gam
MTVTIQKARARMSEGINIEAHLSNIRREITSLKKRIKQLEEMHKYELKDFKKKKQSFEKEFSDAT